MSTKSVDFRPLPTPEQIRAHGEGGLWETENGRYKLWDRDRTTPWYDCRPFCLDGQPWSKSAKRIPDLAKFRPLNPDGTPRDWAEIDAIVAQGTPAAATTATEPEPDYRAPTDDELRAHIANGGMWQDNYLFYEIWTDENDRLLGWCRQTLFSPRGRGWDVNSGFADNRKHLRPVDKQGKPMPWPKVAQSAAAAPDPAVAPPPDGKFQVGDVVRVLRFSSEDEFSDGNPGWNRHMAEHLTETVTIESIIGKRIRAAGWAWPIERVSFVSRPSKAESEQKPATVPTPEFRKLTREIVEANPGQLWECEETTRRNRVWRLGLNGKQQVADFACRVISWNMDGSMGDYPWSEFEWRPLLPQSTYDNRQPMPWSELKATASVPQPISVRLSDGMPLTIATAGPVSSTGRLISHTDSLSASASRQIEDAVRRAIAERVLTQPTQQEVGQVQKPAASFKAWSPDGPSNITSITYSDELDQPEVRSSDGLVIGLTQGVYKAQAHLSGDIGRLPLIFDIVVRHAATDACPARTDILVGCRRTGFDSGKIDLCVDHILHDGLSSLAGIDALGLRSKTLDIAAEQWYSLSRQPNETDEQLRQRCRDAKAKENPMPTIPGITMATMSTPAIPNFTAMSPEDRARYRAALDAADPPTFRDALRSGLEHAPVELALDKLHTFVSRLADLWTEGNEEERATVRRFLRDLLSSDYGKAAIGLGAGAAIPHAAPLAAKLLPDDKDAGPLLRRVGFILVERGTATGAKRLGLDIWDAAGPMLDELRQMLRDLVKGMKQADTVVGFLPPASPKLDFASGVVEAETVTQKH